MTDLPPLPGETLIIADLRVDTAARGVMRDGNRLEIGELSVDLLLALAAVWPEPLDATSMAEKVWGTTHVSEDTIAQRIALLRKALGDEARQPRYIRTVRHRGYALIPAPQTSHPSPANRRHEPSLVRHLPYLVATIGVLLAAGLAWSVRPKASTPSPISVHDTGQDAVPVELAIQLDRAHALMNLHQPSETETAISILEDALAAHPDHVAVRLSLSFALTTRATKFTPRADDVDRAEALARGLIDEDARHAMAWHGLGYALDARGRLDEALAAYQQAVVLDPRDVAAMSSAAYLLQVRGRLHDALVLEARALQTGQPTLYGPLQIAGTLSLLDHPTATLWWRRAQTAGAGETVTLSERLRADLRSSDVSGALDRLEAADPEIRDQPGVRVLEGEALWRQGEIVRAAEAFRAAGDAAELERRALDAWRGLAADGSAEAAMIDAALSDGESWPDLRLRLAAIEAASGRPESAARLVGQAIDLGWRDARWIETAPAFSSLVGSAAWAPLAERITRELDAQRRLVETDPALAPLWPPQD